MHLSKVYQHYGYISSQRKYPQQSDSSSFKRPSRHAPDLGGGFREGDHIICACTLPRSLGSRLGFLYAYGHYGVTKGNHVKAGYVVSEMALNMYFTIVYI